MSRLSNQPDPPFFDVALSKRHQLIDEMYRGRRRVGGVLVRNGIDNGGGNLIALEHADAPSLGERSGPHAQVPVVELKISGFGHDSGLLHAPLGVGIGFLAGIMFTAEAVS
jgi:hypothetical protein